VAPGGTGTEWELFQLVEMVKSRQLAPVPVYLLGDRRHWASLRRGWTTWPPAAPSGRTKWPS
jgi:predicted Rossmann-fold nucleotide-binding protein